MPSDEFKKRYNEEMNRQFPSDESLKNLEAAMDKRSRKTMALRTRSLIAIAACLALLVAFSGPIMDIFNPQTAPPLSKVAESYSDLYSLLSKLNVRQYYTSYGAFETTTDAAAPAAAPDRGASIETSSKADTPDFSDTNLQVAGVQEADIVKSDGKYIYALSNEYLHIVSAVDGELTKLSQIARSSSDGDKLQDSYAFEMYVRDNRLIVLTNYYNYHIMRGGAEPAIDVMPATDATPEMRSYIYPYFSGIVGV
ncbi:MAG: hypothetical protein GX250_07840, partial [Clostridiales bacterium]|nr:hypothetical protein [Clostridiales bacterium]